jgi:hypothetical protein
MPAANQKTHGTTCRKPLTLNGTMITFIGMDGTETLGSTKRDPRMLHFEDWQGRRRCAFQTGWIWSPSGSVADDYTNHAGRNFFNVHYAATKNPEDKKISLYIDIKHNDDIIKAKLQNLRARLAGQIRAIPKIRKTKGRDDSRSMTVIHFDYPNFDNIDQAIQSVHDRFGPEITGKIHDAAGVIDEILGGSWKTGR